jgi:hypothetical protein
MKEEEPEENNFEEMGFTEPEVKHFGLTDLVRAIAILFVFAVYFVILLKIVVLE